MQNYNIIKTSKRVKTNHNLKCLILESQICKALFAIINCSIDDDDDDDCDDEDNEDDD